jgi:hypothetical protein
MLFMLIIYRVILKVNFKANPEMDA